MQVTWWNWSAPRPTIGHSRKFLLLCTKMGSKNSGTHPLRLKNDDNPLDAKTKYDAP